MRAPADRPAASDTSAAAPCLDEALLAIVVNAVPMPATLVLRGAGDRVWVRRADLARWRFALPPAAATLDRDGEAFVALDALAGLGHRIDASTQTLHIDTTAGNFVGTVLGGHGGRAEASQATPGAFLDYDVSIGRADGRAGAGGLFEAVGFGPWGSFASAAVARAGLAGGPAAATDPAFRNGVIRLDTTWTLDRPGSRASWRAGDLVGRGGGGSAPVRLGGLQYATNFATEPSFVTFPLPSFAGEAALPSTVDLYIDDALRMRREVPAGPFSVPELPVVTGSGEARVVVRDLLGRQQTIVAPFQTSARLLRAGLRDFSYEAGALRQGYGLRSNDYRQLVAIGTERRGFSSSFTGEAHAELARRRQAIGAGAVWLWPAAGVFSATLAASRGSIEEGRVDGRVSGHGDGTATTPRGLLLSAGFERQSAGWSAGASVAGSGRGYRPLGRDEALAPRRSAQVYASHALGATGSVGATYVRRSLHDEPGAELLGATYSVALAGLGQLSLTVLRDVRGGRTSAGLGFSTALDGDTSLNASATTQGGRRNAAVQVQRGLPAGEGAGYRLAAVAGDAARAEADLLLQNDHGRVGLEAAVGEGGAVAWRAGAVGAVALLGGHVFASRAIGEGFAVVEAPGFADVRVYAANQLVGRTDGAGAALVPRLLPYQRNAIRIEQADLPLDTTVDALEAEAVPANRGGVLLPFAIRRARGALITVLLDDGLGVPPGSVATLAGSAVEFPAGQHGEVYLGGLEAANVVELAWRGQRCRFAVAFAPGADPLPHLGTFVCRGVAR